MSAIASRLRWGALGLLLVAGVSVLLVSQPGDPNQSGFVDIIDARICLQGAQGVANLDPTQRQACDTNQDGTITREDAEILAEIGLEVNKAPKAKLDASPTSGTAPLTVNFDASGSSDPDGTIETFQWAFGDGNSATGETVQHTYGDDGTFTATLTVTDNDGASAQASVTITPGNAQPTAAISADPTSGTVPLTVSFDASGSSDPDGTIETFEWTFGDGGSDTGETVSHEFTSGGEFTVELTVTDDDGATDSATTTIDANIPPNAAISADSTSGIAPLTVDFDASGSSDPDGTIESYEWAFGDGSSGSGTTASHTYETNDTFTATLTVTDNDGLTDTATTSIDVDMMVAYVTNRVGRLRRDGTVSVIDVATNTVIETIDVPGEKAVDVAVTPDGTKAYVANDDRRKFGLNFKSTPVIDTASHTVLTTVGDTLIKQSAVDITSDGSTAFVVGDGGENNRDPIVAIDTSTDTIIGKDKDLKRPGKFGTETNPSGIAITPDDEKAYVSTSAATSIIVVDLDAVTDGDPDTESELKEIIPNAAALDVAMTPDGSKAYVADAGNDAVHAIDVSSDEKIGSMPAGNLPRNIAITPDGSKAYVTNDASDNVTVIDTTTDTVMTNIDVDDEPRGVAVTPNGDKAYVTHDNRDIITVIDTSNDTIDTTFSRNGENQRDLTIFRVD